MTTISRHGGARRGAGRPRKWRFTDVLMVGQACETRWREASNDALQARLAALPQADEIRALQDSAQAIPVVQRKAWLASEEYEDHAGEIEASLHKRAGHALVGGFEVEGEFYGGDYEGNAPRVVTVTTRPARGTRRRIYAEVAAETGLTETVIKNLWDAYRRFEREPREAPYSAET